MKKRIYIETSIVSYFTSNPSRDLLVAGHQAATREIWNDLSRYECYISALVFEEARKGNPEQSALRIEAIKQFPMLDIDEDAQTLARKILDGKGIPEKYPEDALHIALAAVNGVDIILTWNYSHMNNPFTRKIVRQIIEIEGYECPEICSPEELMEVDR